MAKGETMADPLDALRQPLVPMSPRPAFAAALRRRIENALAPEPPPQGATMTVTEATTMASDRRAGSLLPYICVRDAARAIQYYKDAFGAVETDPPLIGDDGRVGHADLTIGDSRFMLSDEYPEMNVLSPDSLGGTPFSMYLVVDDVDAVFARAVALGATATYEPVDQFYGERSGGIVDPFGHKWSLQTPIEQIDQAELERRAADTGYHAESLIAPAAAAGRKPVELGYFTIGIPDADNVRDFYRELFGWELHGESGGEGYHIANIALPGGLASRTEAPTTTLFFRVDDINAMASKVRELGGEVTEPELHASGWNAHCRDVEGAPFDLWQPAPGY
jgi:uncharacterized glyoxalase superfamily protein PhnB